MESRRRRCRAVPGNQSRLLPGVFASVLRKMLRFCQGSEGSPNGVTSFAGRLADFYCAQVQLIFIIIIFNLAGRQDHL